MEDIVDLAASYNREECTYNAAMYRCREIAKTYTTPWEWVAADFEIACIDLNA
jgi:hypothetical protein